MNEAPEATDFAEVAHKFSISQLNMYANCGVSYYYKYVEDIRPPIPSHNMTVGTLVHALIEEAYRIKSTRPNQDWKQVDFKAVADAILSILILPPQDFLEEGQEPGLKYPDKDAYPPPVLQTEDDKDFGEAAMVNVGIQALQERSDEAVGWTDDEIHEASDLISKLVPTYLEDSVFAQTNPHDDIELKLEFTLAEKPFVGYVDFMDHSDPEHPIIIDLKTAKRRYAETKIYQDIQLLVYAYAYNQLRGIWPGIAYHVLVKKKFPEIQILSLPADKVKQEWSKVEQRVRALLQGIEAGVYLPAPPGSWICNAKWCPYYDSCPYVQGTQEAEDDNNDG